MIDFQCEVTIFFSTFTFIKFVAEFDEPISKVMNKLKRRFFDLSIVLSKTKRRKECQMVFQRAKIKVKEKCNYGLSKSHDIHPILHKLNKNTYLLL